jgi:hypothetical protein
MKIAYASWLGIAGLPDGATDWAAGGGTPSDLVAVTGPPGSGKSRLLYALAHAKERLAPYGSPPPDSTIIEPEGTAKVQITWAISESEQASVGLTERTSTTEVLYPPMKGFMVGNDPAMIELLERYSHSPEVGKLDYVPPDRVLPRSATSTGDFVAEQKRRRLATGSEKYGGIKTLVIDAVRRRDPRCVRLRTLFKDLVPGKSLGSVTSDSDLEVVPTSGKPGSLRTCSSSEWEAFAIAATMVFVGLAHSIILYDTPELHLDDAEAGRRFGVLRAAFPVAQWIVATKSPSIVAAASAVVRLGESA